MTPPALPFFAILVIVLILERLLELRAAKRNTARLLAEGAREYGATHYPVIVAMHVTFFVSLITEYFVRSGPLGDYWQIGLAMLILAQSLRLWARVSLAGRWTSRVIVNPGERLVACGPYALIPHPIYITVALELFTIPFIFGLYNTCIIFSILNACMLLLVRIPCENRALATAVRER